MLYGFVDTGEILIVAGDTSAEFEDIPAALKRSSIVFSTPTPIEMISDPRFAGLARVPMIVKSGEIPATLLQIVPKAEALRRVDTMVYGVGQDDVDTMFSLYRSQQGESETVVERLDATDIMLNSDNMSDVLFAATCDKHNGTIITIVPCEYFEYHQVPVYDDHKNIYRIAHLLDLPESVTSEQETEPGLFNVDISPLAAREQMLSKGFREDCDLTAYVNKRFPGEADASTQAETMRAFGFKSEPEGTDFLFALHKHLNKASTFVIIVPSDFWAKHRYLPDNIFITPLLKRFSLKGYSEYRPCMFEVVKDQEDVKLQLLSTGFIEAGGLRNLASEAANNIRPIMSPAVPIKVMDWDETLKQWDSLSDEQRKQSLPDDHISFCVMEYQNDCFLFLVPSAHFKANASLLDIDLDLDNRIMGSAEKVAANIFKIVGIDTIDLTALMAKNGFRESYPLLLNVNLLLYSSDLPERIGLSTNDINTA